MCIPPCAQKTIFIISSPSIVVKQSSGTDNYSLGEARNARGGEPARLEGSCKAPWLETVVLTANGRPSPRALKPSMKR
jgi:hypothetical protein